MAMTNPSSLDTTGSPADQVGPGLAGREGESKILEPNKVADLRPEEPEAPESPVDTYELAPEELDYQADGHFPGVAERQGTRPGDPHLPPPGQTADGETVLQGGDEDEEYEDYDPRGRGFLWFQAMPSWLISMVVHLVGLFLLATITLPDVRRVSTQLTVSAPDPAVEEVDEFELDELSDFPQLEMMTSELASADEALLESVEVDSPDLSQASELEAPPAALNLSEFADQFVPKSVLTASVGGQAGSGLDGRGSAMRSDMVKRYGGTPGSEAAVAAALKWLAAHQLPDGGWSFDHTIGPGIRVSPNPGELRDARNGATAMALLPFLGAGQTHTEGEYKQVVERGLYFLQSRQNANGGFTESGGSMYSHGLAAITLCEAYAMTGDRRLAGPAQASLNFIAYAQDPVGGGWRYQPRVGGDSAHADSRPRHAWAEMGLAARRHLPVRGHAERGRTVGDHDRIHPGSRGRLRRSTK